MSSRAIRALAVVLLAGAALGQTVPGGEGKKVVLDYREVPVHAVLSDLQQRLGFIFITAVNITDRITLVSGVEVGPEEAAALLNEALWPLRYRLYELPRSNPGPKVLRIAGRSEIPVAGEMVVWKRVAGEKITGDMPVEFAGVSQTATMPLGYRSETVGKILEDLAKTFGFVVDPKDVPQDRVTLLAPTAAHAREAVGLVSELLATGGHKLEVGTVLDARGEAKSLLKVVERKVKVPAAEKVEFRFDNAPLGQVMEELGKRSGYAVTNNAGFVPVTIRETLTVEAFGTDVGAVVAKLNEALLPQGAVVEETSREGAEGKREPLLTAMTIEKARRTVLAAPARGDDELLAAKDWVGVDKAGSMVFRFESVDMDALLAGYSAQLGFIVMSDQRIGHRVTVTVANAVGAGEAVRLLEDVLVPIGYINVQNAAESIHGTVIRVLPFVEGRRYVRTGMLPQHNVAGAGDVRDPPLGPGTAEDLKAPRRNAP